MSTYYSSNAGGFYGSDGAHASQPPYGGAQPNAAGASSSSAAWNLAANSQPTASAAAPSRQPQPQPQLQQQQHQPHASSSTGFYGGDNQQWAQPSQSQHVASASTSNAYTFGSSQMSQMSAPQPQAPTAMAGANISPSFWNPATAATMAAVAGSLAGSGGRGPVDAGTMLDLASTAGKTFLQSGTARMIPGLEATMLLLRRYFAVDNQYVVKKLKRVFFPFLTKNWQRSGKDAAGADAAGRPTFLYVYDLPVVDENAPDLYLPVMSLITYVLLCALCYGTAGKFNPEVIPDVTTKCLATQVLEVLAIRFGFYAMQAPIAMLDLFAYTGYKYLGLCANILAALAVGHFGLGVTGYYVAFCWTASAASFFMLKTMANNIPTVTAATGPKREVVVLAFAASQFATMWFVSQTKFL